MWTGITRTVDDLKEIYMDSRALIVVEPVIIGKKAGLLLKSNLREGVRFFIIFSWSVKESELPKLLLKLPRSVHPA